AALATPTPAGASIVRESASGLEQELAEAEASGDFAKMESAYAKALTIAPKSIALHVNHAEALDGLGKKDDAKAELLAATKLSGAPAEYAVLATRLREVGELTAARKAAAAARVSSGGAPQYKTLYDEIAAA